MKVYFTLVLSFLSLALAAQIIVPKLPGNDFLTKGDNIPVFSFPVVDQKAMLLEDEEEMKYKDVPLRIAKVFNVDIDVLEEAYQFQDAIGVDNYILQLDVVGAKAVGLILSKFNIPEGAELYVFNSDLSSVNGAITSINNTDYKRMQISPVKGDKVFVLYKEPLDRAFNGELNIEIVTHVYRDLFKSEKNFGDAGDCNINVVCDDGIGYEDQARSVGMIVKENGARICTGALINNASLDGTPYFLTADHCLPSDLSDLSVWSFIFNYKSEDCTPSVNGLLGSSVFGSELKASNADSDFALLELDATPPSSYNVYYAGWTNSSFAPSSTKGIHHPHGDVMKISTDDDSPVMSSYINEALVNYWKVIDWDDGTTEGGSSGSPLFNPSGKIIGQLRGGLAACNNDSPDFYGALNKSWDIGTDNDESLKHWLDPGDLGVTSLNGSDLNLLSVEIIQNEMDFIIYPNPAKQTISIRVNAQVLINELRIIDVSGRIVRTDPIQNTLLETKTINIENLSKGMYQVHLLNKDKTYTKTFIKN